MTVTQMARSQEQGTMNENDYIVHSSTATTGDLISLPREKADWEWMSFFVHRLAPGERWSVQLENEEAALVLLGGRCRADWGEGERAIGERANVFDGLPYALYLPAGH